MPDQNLFRSQGLRVVPNGPKNLCWRVLASRASRVNAVLTSLGAPSLWRTMAMELACRPQRHDRLLAMPLSRDVAFRVRILSECRCVLRTTTSQVLGLLLLLLAQWTPVVACVLLGPLQSWLDAGLQLCRGIEDPGLTVSSCPLQ
jgi:hypothetical protein